MDSPLLISNFPVSNIALIYFTLASRGVNKKVKARNGQQSKSEAWVEVLFCCLVPGHMLNFFLRTPPAVCTTSARRHQRQVLFVLFILFDSTRPNKTYVIFLTHSVNVRRRRWYFWLALNFFTECKCKPCHSIGRLHHSRMFDQDFGLWIS